MGSSLTELRHLVSQRLISCLSRDGFGMQERGGTLEVAEGEGLRQVVESSPAIASICCVASDAIGPVDVERDGFWFGCGEALRYHPKKSLQLG